MRILLIGMSLLILAGCAMSQQTSYSQMQDQLLERWKQNQNEWKEKYRECLDSHIPPDFKSRFDKGEMLQVAQEAVEACNGPIHILESNEFDYVYGSENTSSQYQNAFQAQIGTELNAQDAEQSARRERHQWVQWGIMHVIETCQKKIKESEKASH